MKKTMKKGILLMNIGSPSAPSVPAVRRYLSEFLSDKRVIDLPAPVRFLLLYGVILPFRTRNSARAYQAIWTQDKSPLITNSEAFCQALQARLGTEYVVALGMRYGHPNIQQAVDVLAHCEHITLFPLFPQYSSAATGSSIERALALISAKQILPEMTVIRDFYRHPLFLTAQAAQIAPFIKDHDHILFSYHGLPERQIIKGGCEGICETTCSMQGARRGCYRAQCLMTTQLLADTLNLTHFSSSFQSRLGRTPWIKPYTDEVLNQLANKGVKRLAITCPSFVSDCLETLEEIGYRAKEQWMALGGEHLTLIPCMNSSTLWVDAVYEMVK
jgi:protoporphyrin/coproporphyrin ferrochelatase